jgi:hypothetical protein
MTSQDVKTPVAANPGFAQATTASASEQLNGRHIFNPVVDFLCLGGASLAILPLMYFSPASAHPALLGFSFIVADFINHPHFAHSYQIFYRGYASKVSGTNLNRSMQIRYLIAGIILPLAMIAFFAVALLQPTATMLGYGANLMLFLVGWHYTKQGYGMLIVNSVFRKKFFSDKEKDLFRYNAYTCWWLYWLFANEQVFERNLWGLSYYSFDIPDVVLFAALVSSVDRCHGLSGHTLYLGFRAAESGCPDLHPRTPFAPVSPDCLALRDQPDSCGEQIRDVGEMAPGRFRCLRDGLGLFGLLAGTEAAERAGRI